MLEHISGTVELNVKKVKGNKMGMKTNLNKETAVNKRRVMYAFNIPSGVTPILQLPSVCLFYKREQEIDDFL